MSPSAPTVPGVPCGPRLRTAGAARGLQMLAQQMEPPPGKSRDGARPCAAISRLCPRTCTCSEFIFPLRMSSISSVVFPEAYTEFREDLGASARITTCPRQLGGVRDRSARFRRRPHFSVPCTWQTQLDLSRGSHVFPRAVFQLLLVVVPCHRTEGSRPPPVSGFYLGSATGRVCNVC